MKRIVSVILLLVLICSMSVHAADGTAAEAQKILVSVKERIGDTSSFDKFESSSSSDEEGNIFYRFYWSSDNEENHSSMSVSCNSKGIITNYYHYNDDEYRTIKPTINKLTQNEAMEKASALAEALNPDIKDKLNLTFAESNENIYSNDYTFEIKHMENGIEVYGDGGYITINLTGDKIINYSLTYTDDVNYTSIENIISKESAEKAYMEKLGLELRYESAYDGNKIKITPVYAENSANNNKYINALTGEIFERSNESTKKQFSEAADLSAGGSQNSAVREETLSDVEIKELEKVEKLLSRDEIVSLLKKNKYLPLSSDYTLTSYRTAVNYYNDDKRTARLNFRNESNQKSISYAVNMKTGAIEDYYSYSDNALNTTPKLSSKKAYETLKNAAKGLAESYFDEFDKEVFTYPETDKKSLYNTSCANLSYTRTINDIPYYRDYISIGINIYTGEIVSYSIQITENTEFPQTESAISKEKAFEIMFSEFVYEPCYIIDGDKSVPVYMLGNDKPVRIDALKGVLLDYALKEYEPPYAGYNDLDGHYAKTAVETLAGYGIYFDGDSYLPDNAISQKDFIYMLNCCFFAGIPEPRPIDISDVKEVYRESMSRGIIKENEKNPDGTVSRGDAAKYIIRAMGYEEVAMLSDIYKCEFSDVDNYIGYISILKGMNILKGNSDGKFEPEAPLTRGDAAIILYNYLSI